MSVNILVVDDEPDVADLFRQRFRREAREGVYVLHFALSASEALELLGGAIEPRGPALLRQVLDPQSEAVVEWRALTVALMDPLVDLVRTKLGLDSRFAMPHLLQGGTWSAGRKIARELRPSAGPSPIPVAADGTVF